MADTLTTPYTVQHCGHPTALYPWAIIRPDGSLVAAPNGMAFQYKLDAIGAVDALQAGLAVEFDRGQGLPLVVRSADNPASIGAGWDAIGGHGRGRSF